MKFSKAEYIWLDGAQPTAALRCKTRILPYFSPVDANLDKFPEWGYDGSSTYQAEGHSSDLVLRPVRVVNDPIEGEGNYLVLCEVFDEQGKPHATNTRAVLREVLDNGGKKHQPWIGFEQEYTFFSNNGHPLGWPQGGYPAPQGPFYCSVGAKNAFGRKIVRRHTEACLESGLSIYGINAEVMPGQWEFQIGYRGIEGESADPLTISDHLWLARWLMHRIAEDEEVTVSFDAKPVKGDWNGAGMHTNFSVNETRKEGGLDFIHNAIKSLESKHMEHVAVYGHGLDERLTGLHETCHITEFKSGVSDRGASIRIPLHVQEKGYGYFEDRRPNANADPYQVSARLVKTVCNV
ncbi:glutamine synthetase beta-grasp domain-containing protein [Candidatus Uabimicrobium amorphum]|uniref:Glutamine synthetase n=1 Tax=Uabimicrobium amorphum TaxID=2596890 RepID=A0A5S9IIU1_UABAM|nr:glutamine synthetase beta-grasp domain-containing protein [Candidatus Uabimicrobium amorphum]BBM82613.1 glutamine synthetase [Candidatus Uabimicrobium amorphum]